MIRSRRTRRQIVQNIHDALPVQTYHTVDQISKKAGVDWKTCQAYLDDLEFELGLRGEKYCWLETITLGTNKGYRKRRRSDAK